MTVGCRLAAVEDGGGGVELEVRVIGATARIICHDLNVINSRHVEALSEIANSSLLAPTTNYF
jgi:hypothetical protein